MTESPAPYQINSNEFAVTQSHTFYLKHIAELSELQQREGRKRSAIVQDAVDLYYEVSTSETMQELMRASGLPMLDLVHRALKLLEQRVDDIKADADRL